MLVIFENDTKTVSIDTDHCQIFVECEDRGVGVYDYVEDDKNSFASAMRDAMNELTA